MITGYTGGTFDLLHAGHIQFLRKCKNRCDFLVVGLNTDGFASEYKRKPVMSYQERKQALEGCKYVDLVVKNTGGKDSKPAISVVNPKFLLHGDDWTGENYLKQLDITVEWLKENAIELVYIPYTKGISTSEIIKRIKDA